jgi:hypothetical protein
VFKIGIESWNEDNFLFLAFKVDVSVGRGHLSAHCCAVLLNVVIFTVFEDVVLKD